MVVLLFPIADGMAGTVLGSCERSSLTFSLYASSPLRRMKDSLNLSNIARFFETDSLCFSTRDKLRYVSRAFFSS